MTDVRREGLVWVAGVGARVGLGAAVAAVLYHERHRWFYFPRLRPDEVVLLKIYDSKTN